MTAKPMPIRWTDFKEATAYGYCSFCDLKVAHYSAIRVAGEDGPPTTVTLNRGMVRGEGGIYRRSGKYRDNFSRGRTTRKVARALEQAGGALSAYASMTYSGRAPSEQVTHGESVESGTLFRCPRERCGTLLVVSLPDT